MARAPFHCGLLLGLVACGSPIASAQGELSAGHYPRALAEFRALEPEVGQFSAAERADYALSRGVAHLAMGDARAAERWLGRARRLLARAPDALDRERQGALRAAWRSLGHVDGDAP